MPRANDNPSSAPRVSPFAFRRAEQTPAKALLLRRIAPYVWRHKWKLALGFLLLTANNWLAVKVPIYTGAAFEHLRAAASGQADLAPFHRDLRLIVWIASASALFMILRRLLMINASRDMEFDLRNDVFARLLRLPPPYYDRMPTGDLMSRATNDIDAIREVFGPGIMYLATTVTIVPIAVWQMARKSLLLTAIVFLPMLCFYLILRAVMTRLFQRSREVQDALGDISTMAQENIAGVRVVRAYGQESSQAARFDELNRDYVRRNLALARLRAMFMPLILLVVQWGAALLLAFGAGLVISKAINIGDMIAFLGIYSMLIFPVLGFGYVLSVWQRGAAAMARVEHILGAEPDTPTPPPAPDEPPIRGAIELRGLSFAYPGEAAPVLKDVSVAVEAGSWLGVIGPTGGGKSTLAALLPHFYPVARGRLFVDGRDINDISAQSLRGALGLVPQETFLFSDTIAANIAFGAEGEADPERVRRAAEISRLAADVAEFPNGYETLLGERGVNLSGGQKQRASIARAVYREPAILVLDDALSAVDTETEEQILARLAEFMRGRTAIVISHRVSTVRMCGQIVVLDEGRIVERGTHDELVALGGVYAGIHEAQLLAKRLEQEMPSNNCDKNKSESSDNQNREGEENQIKTNSKKTNRG